ncbi:CDP-alcohol phosphatidyltransferase family protein [Actinoplanes sp. KI2]|uniref:CDP-alcohol phosphatidyltransferase family protein n=1 Tax=Actinoplanes sp. KI2 TaxID=2983315 RepID=UPI0021D59728|nr:CDP-alcohol phosphatidyltransferase family protein [Actinoplanes sp. KI2]MCU7725641.1 CDP-alcohol phosphatidyltransferase family protein [Actinoplanes sp. KI2]
MTWEAYCAAWARLHGGFDPRAASAVVRGWVRVAYRMGSWLGARRVAPSAVTTAGLVLCWCVPLVAALGRAPAALGAALVLLAALADGLDGAVAVVSGRASRLGYVYDSVADRLGEVAWLLAFWLVGAPGWLVVAAGTVSWLQEYARARATAAGMAELGVVTVAERPTRVLVAIFGLLAAAVVPIATTVAAAVWLGLGLVGLAQLGVAIRRALAA